MIEIQIFQVGAFGSTLFTGNPAAVCLLQQWLDFPVLQKIAAENNLPETAFLVRDGQKYQLCWFTPEVEIDLCGHATLAAAFVLFREGVVKGEEVLFSTQSGLLTVRRKGCLLELDFQARAGLACATPPNLEEILGGGAILECRASRDLLVRVTDEQSVLTLSPDFQRIATLDYFGLIVTAPGNEVDFVSRCFAPGAGIPEDPVTGSAHCTLVPYWAKKLGKTTFHARQLSSRGGELWCRLSGDRVLMAGEAALYLEGTIKL